MDLHLSEDVDNIYYIDILFYLTLYIGDTNYGV